jgi:hypothetical protein
MWQRLLLAALIAWGAWHWWHTRAVKHGPGEAAPAEPVQIETGDARAFDYKRFRITPLADFRIEARVLGTERYSLGREAELAPIDVAFGWGPMSDNAVIDRLRISQGNRFYMYFWEGEPPIPVSEIVRHSANMHMIPSSPEIEERLERLRTGSVVSLRGKLVQVDSSDNWHWKSSLSRTDSGAGACELVWVEEIAYK